MGVFNCSMFCCMLRYVHSSIAIILMGKRVLVALLNLSSWCLVMVEWLFLAVPRGCLRFVIVVFPDHTHYFRMKAKLASQRIFSPHCNDDQKRLWQVSATAQSRQNHLLLAHTFKKYMKTENKHCTVNPVLSGHSKRRPKADFQD